MRDFIRNWIGKCQITGHFKKTFNIARLPWLTEIYKKKLPCIFQATNEVMFLSRSLMKQQKPFFCNTFIFKFEQMYLPEMRVDMT